MNIITRKRLNEFAQKHPHTKVSLEHWYKLMKRGNFRSFQDVWPVLNRVVFVPYEESEYQQLVAILDDLIDEVGENEDHPLASMMEVIGVLIEKYEEEHVPELTGI